MEEAFPANQRVHVDSDGKLSYKPPYSLKNKQALQVLLKKNHQEGKGGITLSDLNDSIPAAEQNVKSIPDMIDIPTAVCYRWVSDAFSPSRLTTLLI